MQGQRAAHLGNQAAQPAVCRCMVGALVPELVEAHRRKARRCGQQRHRQQRGEGLRKVAVVGEYELAFHVADFYEPKRATIGDPMFLDRVVPLRFAIFDAKQHYHVPLLCTPWSCSTYRGS